MSYYILDPYMAIEYIFRKANSMLAEWMNNTSSHPFGMAEAGRRHKNRTISPNVQVHSFICSIPKSGLFAVHLSWLLKWTHTADLKTFWLVGLGGPQSAFPFVMYSRVMKMGPIRRLAHFTAGNTSYQDSRKGTWSTLVYFMKKKNGLISFLTPMFHFSGVLGGRGEGVICFVFVSSSHFSTFQDSY